MEDEVIETSTFRNIRGQAEILLQSGRSTTELNPRMKVSGYFWYIKAFQTLFFKNQLEGSICVPEAPW